MIDDKKQSTRNTVTPAHKTLVDESRRNKRRLIQMLEDCSRDYESLRLCLESHISHQHAADLVSGQVKE